MFPVVIAMFSMLSIMIGVSYLLGLCLELGLIGLAPDEIIRGLLVFIRWLKGPGAKNKWLRLGL